MHTISKKNKTMNKYYADYGTGAGNFVIEGNLEKAMEAADEGIAYTQTFVCIKDYGTHKNTAFRRWYGVSPDNNVENSKDIIDFGNFGYYDNWQILP